MTAPTEAIGADYVARLAQEATTRTQLAAAMALALHRGEVDVMAGASQVGGPWAKAEASYRLTPAAALVAEAGWQKTTGFGVSAGWRWRW